jgi:hypothetical protein
VKGKRSMAESWLSNRMRQIGSSKRMPRAPRAARGRNLAGPAGCTTVRQYEFFAKVIQ